ncbi:hypothetical protein MNBD_NITROSPINAE02-956 [hydrothermal vent metagenome]|uniref:Flagellar assembly protein T N-terminal domain-containing protein n=1 Tax=hydrothermal vent metagenome TaxID=652676 RepID=A0A3B1BL22_9ZZZZ
MGGFVARFVLFVLAFSACGQAWAGSSSPRFMILIDEKNMGTYSMNDAERIITAHLSLKGAEVVDAELVKTNVNRDKALHAMTSDPRAAAAIGLQFGADIIIVGKAIAKGSAEHVRNSSMRSYRASVSLRAIKTDTAEVLVTDTNSVARIHVDDIAGGSLAIQDATKPLIARLTARLFTKIQKQDSAKSKNIRLLISSVSQIWQVAALKKLLRNDIRGVEDVVQRNFVNGVANFDVYWRGDSQALAEELTLAKPGYFKIKVVSVTPNKLDAKLVEGGS